MSSSTRIKRTILHYKSLHPYLDISAIETSSGVIRSEVAIKSILELKVNQL